MKVTKRFFTKVPACMLGLTLCLLGAAMAFAQQTELSKSEASLINSDIEQINYDQLCERMSQGEQLSEVEKALLLDLESRLGIGRTGGNGLDNQGGPDAFSYFFMDNQPPDTSTYSWIELRDDGEATWIGGLTHFTNVDDGYSRQKLPIGFPFPFYGVPYDCVRVATNGFLQFTTTAVSLSNVCLPASAIAGPMIAVFWDDLHLVRGGQADSIVVGYKNFGDYFVIEFDQIGFYSSSCPNNPLKFEAILYPNGNIKLQYHTITPPVACDSSHTIGIQQAGAAGSTALTYVCNTTGIQAIDELAIWFFRPVGIPRPCTNLVGNVVGSDVVLTWLDPTLDTQGNPLTIDNVQVWLGAAESGTLIATVGAGVQTFTHVNAPTGNLTYTVRPFHDPFFGTPLSIPIVMGTPSYSNDFEADGGLWEPTPETGGWGWGQPWGIANLIPHSGLNVWGTNLTGNYGNSVCWQLDFDEGYAVVSPAATIEFWYWNNSQLNYDGTNFKASVDNGATWTILTPTLNPYNTPAMNAANACIPGQPGWSGTTPLIWRNVVIPVGEFLGQAPIFRFEFGSNISTNSYPGFYFDDMTMWGLQPQAGIPQACTDLAANDAGGNVELTWTDPTHDTQGNEITIDNVQVWLGTAGIGTLLGTVNAGVQAFTHNNAPSGVLTYSVRPYLNPFFGNPTSVSVVVGSPTYNNDFNTDDGMWIPTNGWSWGAPTNPSAPPPYSDPNYWGTGLAANYVNNACWQTDLNLGLVVESPSATVEFWYRFDTELNYDGCNFKASIDEGATWEILTPSQGPYTITSINAANACMAGQPAWSGHTQTAWQYAVIPVGQYIGQAPIFRFEFGTDPSIFNFMGFFFDDMIIWGLALPQSASVTGTVTLDGVGGTMTNVSVIANGLGSPNTHPDASGAYTLAGVQVGDRILSAMLTGYLTDTIVANVPAGGLVNQNFVLRRVNPPSPTGLTGTVDNTTGIVSLNWNDSPDLQVDLYKIYRKLRTDQTWAFRRNILGRTNSQGLDTVSVGGIYQYQVTALDTNVFAPPVESDPSNTYEAAYGALPPQSLVADTAFDNKIHLSWLDPLASPGPELFYDNGENTVQGIGFWNATSPLESGWLVSKFEYYGPVTITGIKTFFTSSARTGDVYEVGVFGADADGLPMSVPQCVVQTSIPAANNWHTVTLDPPVTISDGVFFVGARQTQPAPQALCIGGDATAQFQSNTFYSCGATDGGWATYESSSLFVVPMQRCFVHTAAGKELESQNERHMGVRTEMFTSGPILSRKTIGWNTGEDFDKRVDKDKSAEERIPAEVPTSRAGMSMTDFKSNAQPQYFPEHPASMAPVYPDRHGGRSSLDDVVRYIIYRNNQSLDSVVAAITQYDNIVGSANENVPYTYQVTARYDNGQESPASNTVTARCGMPPGAPTNVGCNPVGNTQMQITWTNPTVNADNSPCIDLAGTKLYRDGALLSTVGPGVQSYIDTPPNPTTRYTWTVRAIDEVPLEGSGASTSCAVQSPWRTVPYEWVDISQNGTDTGLLGDDDNAGPIDLGFSFPYYGTPYTSFYVCSNGWLSFTSTVITYVNVQIPAVAEPNCVLYAFWDDLTVVSGTGWVKYLADPANQRFIVSYHVRRLGGTVHFDFQIILYANGGVRYNYQTLDVVNGCTIGVENCDGTAAEQLLYNGVGDFTPTTESAVEFWGGASSSIVGMVSTFTNIPIPNARIWAVGQPDTVTTDSVGVYRLPIEPGTYSVTVDHRNFCDSTFQNIVVEEAAQTQLDAILYAPSAQFSATSLSLLTSVGVPVQQTFTISNLGGQCPLDFAISDTATWLSAAPPTGTIGTNQVATITVSANVAGMPVGDYWAPLIIVYNAVGTPNSIRVDLVIQTTAADEPNAPLPSVFALQPTYPNPFNATTALRFDVPQQSRVQLAIYNVMGQEVARPVDDVYAAGRYRILFDAANLPSGMYLVKMSAGGFSQTGKMLLLK